MEQEATEITENAVAVSLFPRFSAVRVSWTRLRGKGSRCQEIEPRFV